MYDTGVAQDVATTAFGRDLTKDQIDFGQQLQRDEAQRRFLHEENKLINLDYKNATRNRGRAGHVQPSGPGGGGGVYTPARAMQHLLSVGAPPMVAAGIVGNIAAETGWDPAVFEGRKRGDAGSAAYAGQWRNERQQHLLEYARSRGHAQPSFEDQLEFFLVEADSGRDPGATKAIQLAATAKSPEEAATYIMTHYERPRDASSLPTRQAGAHNAFNMAAPSMSSAPAALPGSAADAMMAPDQRRYADPSTVTVGTEQPTPTDGGMEPLHVWGTQDFVDNGLTPWYMEAVPKDMDVVGMEWFSGASIDTMDPALKSRIMPVGGLAPDETGQYLLLAPKQGLQLDPAGNPVAGAGVSNAIGGGPAVAPQPLPDITESAAQVRPMQGQPTALDSAPTGKRTRINEQGQREFLVDDQWRTIGG
jgi:hypothetical protein